MNILKITQVNRWFVVELGDSKLHMLNQKSLVYFLKKQVGFNMTAIASIQHVLEHEPMVEINLDHTERKVS